MPEPQHPSSWPLARWGKRLPTYLMENLCCFHVSWQLWVNSISQNPQLMKLFSSNFISKVIWPKCSIQILISFIDPTYPNTQCQNHNWLLQPALTTAVGPSSFSLYWPRYFIGRVQSIECNQLSAINWVYLAMYSMDFIMHLFHFPCICWWHLPEVFASNFITS